MSRRITVTIAALAALSAVLASGQPAALAAAPTPAPTTISVSTDKTTYVFNDAAVVTIHLSPTATNKDVLLFSQLFGQQRKLIAGGPVGADGNFRTQAPMWTKTVLTAVYRGDAADAPASASITREVHAVLTARQLGFYATSADGRYRLYHRAAPPSFRIGLTPTLTGDCVRFERQHNSSTGWQPLDTSRCFDLSSGSSFYNALANTRRGVGSRIRVDFAGNAANLGTTSGWMYYKWWS